MEAATDKSYSLVIHFPCPNGADTVGIMRKFLNIPLVECYRIARVGRPYRVPFLFSRDEVLQLAAELQRIATPCQVTNADGTPLQ